MVDAAICLILASSPSSSCTWGELDRDVGLVADPDDDQPSACIRHGRDVTSEVAPRRITVPVALLFEIEIRVLAHTAGDEERQGLLRRILGPSAEEIGQSKRPRPR
jgi:hypothetical protein